VSPLADALMVIVEAVGPGGLLAVAAAALVLQVTDTISDIRDAREGRAAE
jgi:hypothetical protein